MEVCPRCRSAWRPIMTRSAEQCAVCQFQVMIDCCSGVCENEPKEKIKKTTDTSNTSDG